MLLRILTILCLIYSVASAGSDVTRVPVQRNINFSPDGIRSLLSFYNKYNVTPHGLGPFHRNKNGTLMKLQQGTEVAASDQQNDLFYTSLVSVGTPGQLLSVTFDTGSADFWVWSSRLSPTVLAHAGSHHIPVYDPSKSTSSQNIAGSIWSIRYADSSSCSGTAVTDILRLGDISIENQAVEVATYLSLSLVSDGDTSQGILGLGFSNLNKVRPYPQKTPIDNMVAQKDIPQNQELFTCYLGSYKDANDPVHGQSFFTFGNIDEEVVNSTGKQISYTPVNDTSGHWQFDSEFITINGRKTTRPGNTAIADTGSTLMYIDDSLVAQIYSTIPGARQVPPDGPWYFPANSTAGDMPMVGIAVGGTEIIIEKEHLGYAFDNQTGLIFGGIEGNMGSGYNVFGDTFLKNVYAVFDVGNKQLGVVQRLDVTQNITGHIPEPLDCERAESGTIKNKNAPPQLLFFSFVEPLHRSHLKNTMMRRFVASVGQTLVLVVLFVLIVIQQLHQQPTIDKVLGRSYYTATNSSGGASGSPTNLSFPSHSLNWSTPQRSLVAPTSLQPTVHVYETSFHLTSTALNPQTSRLQVESRSEQAHEFAHLTFTSAAPHITVPQFLQIDCNARTTDTASFDEADKYVQSVMNFDESTFPRLQCPTLNSTRYTSLRHLSGPTRPKYFFAMNLHQSAHIIPQLLGAIVEAVRILSPELCFISVVEGRSTDGTFEILKSLVKEMEHLGVSYVLSCSDMQPGGEGMERISALAELRNTALKPLTKHPEQFDTATTVVFLNDIAPCAEDILELILQRVLLQADMTCGMDWYNLDDGEGGTFYDSWIGRQMNGEPFFEVPQSTSWDFSKNLFWNHEKSKSRYLLRQPLQVFSCWNGAAAIAAKPFMDGLLRFRTETEGECHLGEPVHLAKDLWRSGYGRIALIPSVNVGYSAEDSRIAKEAHGWVSSLVDGESTELNRIVWEKKPPGQIKCLEEVFHRQSWEPFDVHR
ncbi:hypothetical protein H2200_011444 [Cladophialophora chaetospira]|uniref:Peptidase A1 domain-containing protein n=1 Tax=Cladophialophora chaetospira TaxID=386627 RepID=A0AA39CD84_9EURO|nr:hypothetical protein H2200_011444 [Cladophialophora chaetospira]